MNLSSRQQQILDYLSSHPQKSYYLRQLAEALDVDPGNLSRDLSVLVNARLIKRQKFGNQVHFSVGRNAELARLGQAASEQEISKKLKELEPDLIKFVQDLIRIPSVSGEHPEREVADFIYKFAKSYGLRIREATKNTFRPNLILDSDPDKTENFLLLGHMDTVAIGAISDWNYYPFSGHISGGHIIGRGAADMKAGIACELFTLILIKELDLDLPYNVRVALVSNEEGGSGDTPIFEEGMEFLIKNGFIKGKAAVYGYGGSYNIGIGHRGVLRVRIKTHGQGVHTGSVKWQDKARGVNAVSGMAEIILALENMQLPKVHHPAFAKHENMITPGTMILHGGSAISTVPAECTTVVEVRYLPGVDIKKVYDEMKEICDKVAHRREGLTVHLEKFVDIPAVVLPENEPTTNALKESVQEVYNDPISTRGTGPANESFMLIRAGIPTVVFGPTGSGAHSPNEFVNINSLTKTIHVYLKTIQTLNNF